MGGRRSITPEESRRLVAALRELLARYGTQGDVASALGVTQQAISAILSGDSRGSYAMARRTAQALNISVESLLSGAPDAAVTTWRTLVGWEAAVAQARALFPRTTGAAWEWLGSLSGPPLPLSPMALGLMASAHDQANPDHDVADTQSIEQSTVRKKSSR